MTIQESEIVSLRLNVGSREAMVEVDEMVLVAGKGIEGDRHFQKDGKSLSRQILLMDRETLGEFDLSDGQIRENITVRGVELSALVEGSKLSIGEGVVLNITGDCEPCPRMDEIREGLQRALEDRRGVLAYPTSGGIISIGDRIHVLK